MRVLVAFSLTNEKTQPYKSTSPPVKMRTGPCARLPRDLGSALSEPARLSLGLKRRSTSWNGSSDPRRHTALLSTAQRLLLPPAAATPTVTASTSMGYGGRAPGRVRSSFVGNTVVSISISGSYCCPHLHHLSGTSPCLPLYITPTSRGSSMWHRAGWLRCLPLPDREIRLSSQPTSHFLFAQTG